MKKTLKLDAKTGVFSTPAGEKYALTITVAGPYMVLTPFSADNTKAYEPILLVPENPQTLVGNTDRRLYVVSRVSGEEMTVSDFYKGSASPAAAAATSEKK